MSKLGFHVVDGEAFIDGTPVKMLVERARENGWCSGPRPLGTLTYQQATQRAHASDAEPEIVVQAINGESVPDGTDDAPPPSPPRFEIPS